MADIQFIEDALNFLYKEKFTNKKEFQDVITEALAEVSKLKSELPVKKEALSKDLKKLAGEYGELSYLAAKSGGVKTFKKRAIADFGEYYPSIAKMSDEDWQNLYDYALANI